jgi:hypothetical protein
MQSPVDFYEQSAARLLIKIRSLKGRLFWIAMARLAAFLALVFTLYYHISAGHNLFPVIAIEAILFVILLRVFFRVKAAKNLAEQLLFVHQNEIAVLKSGVNGFDHTTGARHVSVYDEDLDIFGERSLYHFLNRTTTTHGSARLSRLLDEPLITREAIMAHQAAVKHFAQQAGQRSVITANGLLLDKKAGDTKNIDEWIGSEGRLFRKVWINIARFILPVFNIGAFFYYLDTNNTVFITIGIVISWLFIGAYGKYIHTQYMMIGKKQPILKQYATILQEFNHIDAGSSALLQQLFTTSSTGTQQIKKLSQLSSFFDQRLNLLVNFILNSFLVYDIHCMVALEKWKHVNRNHYSQWFDAVGEIEMLNSLATFAFNNPAYCFPEIVEGKPVISAEAVAHPLIPANECVSNDFSIGKEEKLLLVTGSNMSGKSTFLRTVGINLLLAQCGAPVCAKRFRCTTMRILTSIRINDSLQEHTSYFMAELKRLRQVITVLETGVPALVLIDEVLRGTNSSDKTHGSEALIQKLIAHDCLAIFATHDLSLSELENVYPSLISNCCFESRIENGELLFDYRLRRGVATNKNATFLMQKMGIISA